MLLFKHTDYCSWSKTPLLILEGARRAEHPSLDASPPSTGSVLNVFTPSRSLSSADQLFLSVPKSKAETLIELFKWRLLNPRTSYH